MADDFDQEDPFKKYGGKQITDTIEDPFKKYGGKAIVSPEKKKGGLGSIGTLAKNGSPATNGRLNGEGFDKQKVTDYIQSLKTPEEKEQNRALPANQKSITTTLGKQKEQPSGFEGRPGQHLIPTQDKFSGLSSEPTPSSYEKNQEAYANSQKYNREDLDIEIDNAERVAKGETITVDRSKTSLPNESMINTGSIVTVNRQDYINELKKQREGVNAENEILKSNADKALSEVKKNLKSHVEYITDKEHIDYFTTKSNEGDKIPDPYKIDEYAAGMAEKYGIKRGGYYYDLLKNEISSNIKYKIIEPKIVEEFDKKFKEKYGGTLDEMTAKEVEAGANVNKVIEQSKIQAQSIFNGISELSKKEIEGLNISIGENIAPMKSAYEQQAAAIKLEYENAAKGVTTEEEGKALYDAATSKMAQLDGTYKEEVRKLNDVFLKSQNEINSKYNSRYTRQLKEIEKIASSKLEDEYKKYKRSPELQKKVEDVYKEASSEVFKNQQKFLDERDYKYNAVANFRRSFTSAFGGAIKSISSSLGITDGEVYGDYLASMNQHGSTEIKKFKDLLDLTKFAKSAGTFTGGTLPSMVAGAAVAYATGGAGAPALLRAIAGGFVGMKTETLQIVGDTYNQVFAETGSVEKAQTAAKRIADSQGWFMLSNTIQMLPFLGKAVKLGKNAISRIAVGGTVSAFTETVLEEYPQNLFQEAVLKGGNYWEGFKGMSWKGLGETALNVAPLSFVMGGSGQAMGAVSDARQNAIAKEEGRTFALKNKFNVGVGMQDQFLFDMMQKKGKNFSTAYVGALYSNGMIDEEKSEALLKTVATSDDVIKNSEKYGLTPVQQKVYAALMFKRNEAKLDVEHESDPIFKTAAEGNVKEIEEQMVKLASGEQTDYTLITYPNGEQYVLTTKEAEKAANDKRFIDAYANKDISVETFGKRGAIQKKLDEVDAAVKRGEVFGETAKPQEEEVFKDARPKAPVSSVDAKKADIESRREKELAEFENSPMLFGVEGKEVLITPTGEISRETINAKYDTELAALEKPQPSSVDAPQAEQPVSSDALKNVESTTKALEEANNNKDIVTEIEKSDKNIEGKTLYGYHSSKRKMGDGFQKGKIDRQYEEAIQEAYQNFISDYDANLENGDYEAMASALEKKGYSFTYVSKEPIEGSAFQADKYKYGDNLYKIYGKGDDLILNDPNELNAEIIVSKEPLYVKGVKSIDKISEAYHKAKADGSNPELVKAVEQSLPTQEVKAEPPTVKKEGDATQPSGKAEKLAELETQRDMDVLREKAEVGELDFIEEGKLPKEEVTMERQGVEFTTKRTNEKLRLQQKDIRERFDKLKEILGCLTGKKGK